MQPSGGEPIKRVSKQENGYTLMELLIVVSIMTVLAAVVAAAVVGVKGSTIEGLIKGDAKAAQAALDRLAIKLINRGQFPLQFPEKRPGQVVTTAGSSNFHIYADVVKVGGDTGDNVVLVRKDGTGETLADKVVRSGNGTGTAVFKRRLMDFDAEIDIKDATGTLVASTFVPDLLAAEPTSLILKGRQTKHLGGANNVFEEYLWLLLVNKPKEVSESRAVEVYRLSKADCSGAVSSDVAISGRTQPSPSALAAATVTTLKGKAKDCGGSGDTVNALIYDLFFQANLTR